MIRFPSVPANSARLAACLALMLVLAARGRSEETPATLSLSALSAARESAAAPATSTPTPAVTPAAGAPVPTPAPVVATPVAAGPAHATDSVASNASAKAARDEMRGLLNLGASLTDRPKPDFEAAEIAYRQVLNAAVAQPDEVKSALLGLARMHRKQGELTKAAAIYERFLADYPGDDRTPDALLDLGRTLREMGAYKLAIARFYNVITSTVKMADEGFDRYQILAKTAQFEIAETHFAAGEFDEANKYYMKFRLLDVAPQDRARAHFKAGSALLREGRLEDGVTTLRAFIEQWPDDENIPEARYLLATTLRELKRPQEAFAATLDLLRAEKSRVDSAPKRWAYWQRRTGNQLANDFFESGDIIDAHTIYTRLLELSPEMSWRLPITYQLGLCYERLGISDRARSSYESVVSLAGPKPAPEFSELAQMAAWRIEHLSWREKVTREISSFFESTTGKQASIPAANKAAATP